MEELKESIKKHIVSAIWQNLPIQDTENSLNRLDPESTEFANKVANELVYGKRNIVENILDLNKIDVEVEEELWCVNEYLNDRGVPLEKEGNVLSTVGRIMAYQKMTHDDVYREKDPQLNMSFDKWKKRENIRAAVTGGYLYNNKICNNHQLHQIYVKQTTIK